MTSSSVTVGSAPASRKIVTAGDVPTFRRYSSSCSRLRHMVMIRQSFPSPRTSAVCRTLRGSVEVTSRYASVTADADCGATSAAVIVTTGPVMASRLAAANRERVQPEVDWLDQTQVDL